MILNIEPPEVKNIGWSVGITVGSLILYQIVFFVLKKWAANKERFLPALLQNHIYLPGLAVIFIITLNTGLLFLGPYLKNSLSNALRITLEVALIIAIAFLASRALSVVRELLLKKYNSKDASDFSYRKANTKYQLLEKVFNVVIIIAAACAIILIFDAGRKWSSGLLASAGVVGLVIGFAAQKSLGTLFAGIQVAVSEPIRLEDIVEVEGLQGVITEINLTFVVVRGYDGNNVIVPINYFLDNAFNNWTRMSPKVLGTVKLSVDYSLPIDEIRKVCMHWIEESPLWDKRSKNFLVTDSTEKTAILRIRMSAKDSDDAFDLECYIREKLITYIQINYPASLPKERMSIEAIAPKQEGKAL